jgi:tetratricopeptide (TPR) repeat protein
MSKTVQALILASVLSSQTAVLYAQTNRDEAKAQFRNGVKLFEEERYFEAVRAFRHATELNPSWKIDFNIGQCEAALKRYGLAMEAFERYLAVGGDEVPSDRRDFVVAELQRLREMIGNLQILAPDGLTVFIDGEIRGNTPMDAPIRVTAGVEHKIVFMDRDWEMGSRLVTVGSSQTVEVELPLSESSALTEPPARIPEESVDDEETKSGKGISSTFFWIGVAATGVFGVGTIALELAVRAKWKDAQADPANQSLKQDGKTLQALGITSLCLTGAAAMATGVLVAFTDFSRSERMGDTEAKLAFSPVIMEGGGGVAVQGRF